MWEKSGKKIEDSSNTYKCYDSRKKKREKTKAANRIEYTIS